VCGDGISLRCQKESQGTLVGCPVRAACARWLSSDWPYCTLCTPNVSLRPRCHCRTNLILLLPCKSYLCWRNAIHFVPIMCDAVSVLCDAVSVLCDAVRKGGRTFLGGRQAGGRFEPLGLGLAARWDVPEVDAI
jgi:hypothetical protein